MTNLAEPLILEFAWASDGARLPLSRGRYLMGSSANRIRHPNLNEIGVRLWTVCFKKGKTIETLVGRSSVPAELSPVGRDKATHRENSPGQWT